MIRDRFTLGLVAGMLGTIPGLILNWISVALGFSRFYSFQLTGGVFLFPGLTNSVQGMILGGIVWLALGGLGGVLIAYLFKLTGPDYWWVKSMSVSIGTLFIALYGFAFLMGNLKIVPFDFATNMTELVSNLVYGLTTGFLILRWGLLSTAKLD